MAEEIESWRSPAEQRRGGASGYLRFSSLQDIGPNGGVEMVLSGDAYRLHLYATMDSLTTSNPGIVADAYLASQRGDLAPAVASLCAAGLWERCDGGFRILDAEVLEAVGETAEWASQVAEECITGDGHVPDATDSSLCAVCHGPIPSIDTGGNAHRQASVLEGDPPTER